MNGKQLYDAVEYVGQDLIATAETQRFSRPVWQSLLPVAAMAAILIGIGAAVHPVQPPVSVIPPQQEEAPVLEAPAVSEEVLPEEAEPVPEVHPLQAIFPQLDPATLPAEAEDWDRFYVNEAGLEESGTELRTMQGDQVLAVDARNGILLIRVEGTDYKGVLAIARDPRRLSQQASAQIGITGETVGSIAEAHNGILAITGSRSLSEDGTEEGGEVAAYTMCEGVTYKEDVHLDAGFVRLEIDAEGWFHLTDPQSPISADTTNAVEVPYALIRDGEIAVEEGLTGIHPRACMGQTQTGEVLMLAIEGRLLEYSMGATMAECAAILQRYGCENALVLDTGSSVILWYDGEYVTRCSNRMLSEGRLMPTAFVVERMAD